MCHWIGIACQFFWIWINSRKQLMQFWSTLIFVFLFGKNCLRIKKTWSFDCLGVPGIHLAFLFVESSSFKVLLNCCHQGLFMDCCSSGANAFFWTCSFDQMIVTGVCKVTDTTHLILASSSHSFQFAAEGNMGWHNVWLGSTWRSIRPMRQLMPRTNDDLGRR